MTEADHAEKQRAYAESRRERAKLWEISDRTWQSSQQPQVTQAERDAARTSASSGDAPTNNQTREHQQAPSQANRHL